MPPRNITLPPVHNTRAPAQWEIISQHVDFDGKTVLDLGCGYGDLLWRAWAAGAEKILGVESDMDIQNDIGRAADSFDTLVLAYYCDIELFIEAGAKMGWKFDIAVCFSVLSYLKDPTATLHWMREHSTQALIECQYAGDGPGFDWIKDDYDMRRWLANAGFETIEPIGKTFVECRDTYRTIWLCQ